MPPSSGSTSTTCGCPATTRRRRSQQPGRPADQRHLRRPLHQHRQPDLPRARSSRAGTTSCPAHVRAEARQQVRARAAPSGILNAPDASLRPATRRRAGRAATTAPRTTSRASARNKLALQERAGPRRQIPTRRCSSGRRGSTRCRRAASCWPTSSTDIVSDYWDDGLQIVVVANGATSTYFHDIVEHHELHDRVAVCDFDEELSRLGYAASDFMLMPSRFEPCGLPQMISAIYGSLPIVHDTGGLHDTVRHLDVGGGHRATASSSRPTTPAACAGRSTRPWTSTALPAERARRRRSRGS